MERVVPFHFRRGRVWRITAKIVDPFLNSHQITLRESPHVLQHRGPEFNPGLFECRTKTAPEVIDIYRRVSLTEENKACFERPDLRLLRQNGEHRLIDENCSAFSIFGPEDCDGFSKEVYAIPGKAKSDRAY